MTQNLKVLNSKEIKHIYEQLQTQFGFEGKLDVAFLLSEKKERIYIFTKDLANIDISSLRVDTMGLYFATMYEDHLRLTIEGTQLIGPQCTKNVIDLTKKEMQTWMLGEKLALSEIESAPSDMKGFVIMRYGKNYIGCGKVGGELILNYIPKTRYIHALYDDIIIDDGAVKE